MYEFSSVQTSSVMGLGVKIDRIFCAEIAAGSYHHRDQFWVEKPFR